LSQLAKALTESVPLKRQVGPILVVFGFPSLQLRSKIPFMFETTSLVELQRIGFYGFVRPSRSLQGSLEECVGERCGGRKDAK
jgi:hypothetical protein